jgi:hypothetical protein
MPKNINSASRLLAIVEPLVHLPDDQQTVNVWAKAFSIEPGQVLKLARPVAVRLECMQRELDIVAQQMKGAGYSEQLYSKALSDFESAISPMLLSTNWHNIKQHFPEANLVALRFCSEIIPDEEAEIASEDLGEIEARVAELRELLATSELSARLRTLIIHHLELIEQALAEYPIAGVKALREAVHKGVGEIVEVGDTLKGGRDAREVSKLGDLWRKVVEATDMGLKAEQAARLGQRILDAIGGFIP